MIVIFGNYRPLCSRHCLSTPILFRLLFVLRLTRRCCIHSIGIYIYMYFKTTAISNNNNNNYPKATWYIKRILCIIIRFIYWIAVKIISSIYFITIEVVERNTLVNDTAINVIIILYSWCTNIQRTFTGIEVY